MRLLVTDATAPSADVVEAAAAALEAGQVVVVPTDTVYGVAAAPARLGATAGLFTVKRRPPDLALPVLVSGLEQAETLASLPSAAVALASRFWPGALTIVVARRPEVDLALGGPNDGTIGLRQPDHAVPLALLRRVGPLATTSANRHGQPTPVTAVEVEADFGEEVALVLDAGPCAGAPSTVVSCLGDDVRVLRVGRIGEDEVRTAL